MWSIEEQKLSYDSVFGLTVNIIRLRANGRHREPAEVKVFAPLLLAAFLLFVQKHRLKGGTIAIATTFCRRRGG